MEIKVLQLLPFNKPTVLGTEKKYIWDAIDSHQLCGGKEFGSRAEELLSQLTGCDNILITPSCTAALEMAAILIDIKQGDEVILPSYTFVSTANAFALRGAKIIFVDLEPDTMNLDVNLVEQAITEKTKAIVPVHYAGVACDMNALMAIAEAHNIFVIEDAAQAIDSYYGNEHLGTIGHFGTFSFHETKNITSGGEGGALLINDNTFYERAEIIREKGTDRSKFFRGAVDKYSWVDIGSSFLVSELQSAYLVAQLEGLNLIQEKRKLIWYTYFSQLKDLEAKGKIELPNIPAFASNNAHMFYIKCTSLEVRNNLIRVLKESQIQSVFHYVPLHSSTAGKKLGKFFGEDSYTTKESEKLLRLPLFYSMGEGDACRVCEAISNYFNEY